MVGAFLSFSWKLTLEFSPVGPNLSAVHSKPSSSLLACLETISAFGDHRKIAGGAFENLPRIPFRDQCLQKVISVTLWLLQRTRHLKLSCCVFVTRVSLPLVPLFVILVGFLQYSDCVDWLSLSAEVNNLVGATQYHSLVQFEGLSVAALRLLAPPDDVVKIQWPRKVRIPRVVFFFVYLLPHLS